MTVRLSPKDLQKDRAAALQQAAPPSGGAGETTAPDPPSQPDEFEKQIVDRIVSSEAFNNKVLSKMGRGEEITIKVENGEVTIRSDGPSLAQKFVDGSRRILSFGADEAAGIIQADPAFAFKEAALVAKNRVAQGLPPEVSPLVEKGFLPMIRLAALALDVKKFLDTRKNPDASKLDKAVDGAHVVTDLAGVGGAVAFSVPALGALAVPLTIVGFAGDVGAYSYHILQYLRERGKVHSKEKDDAAIQPVPPQPPQDPAGEMRLAS